MSETNAIIRFTSDSPAILKRIQFYLHGDTRPDFEEEVASEEKAVFEAMEFAEIPFQIEQRSENTLDAYFECVNETELENLIKALSWFKPDGAYLYFADDEEYKVYKQYHEGLFIDLYHYMDDEALDNKLLDLDWDHRAFDLIIDRHECNKAN